MSISLDRLTKIYGSHPVVDQVSLELPNGEFFVLLGTSGSGKSTVLRLIAGLIAPDSGTVVLHGRDVTKLPPQKRGTGFVFQNYSIFRHMSVAENVEFGLKIRRIPPQERARKREQLLDLVGLAGFDNRYAGQLSGGQLQRVALARALAYEPNVLLLDEPFGALDSKIRTQLRRSLKEIQRRLKVTTILVTHDQEEAFELADRIGIIERGRLLETGPPENLYAAPKTLFVATFLGAGTVLAGKADSGSARFGSLSLPIPPETAHEQGARAQVLFRPEQVVLSPDMPDGGTPLLGRGRVVERTFSGPFQRVRLQLPHLEDTRQVAPHVPFGEEGLLVDALVPSEMRFQSETVWVELRSWHILDQPRQRLLVYAGYLETVDSCLDTAKELSEQLDASSVLLGVAEDQASVESLGILLQQQKTAHGLDAAELQVYAGDPAEHLARLQQDGNFDLLVIGGDSSNTILTRMLECCTVPMLVVRQKRSALKRMLICTAAGEPGKTDVRVGGRLAHRLKSAVTLLHVTPPGSAGLSPITKAHLERAVSTLRGLDTAGSVQIREAGSATEGILEEAREGGHDLIVVGVHSPRSHSIFHVEDITFRVLAGAQLPVLVVPIEVE